MERCHCRVHDCPRCFPGTWPSWAKPGLWNRFGLEQGEEYFSLDDYRDTHMLIHLANGSLKPLCGKLAETEPLEFEEPGAEYCLECTKRAARNDGGSYILLGELVADEEWH